MSDKGGIWWEVRRNPTLYGKALLEHEGPTIRWHTHAHRSNSSQVFCISAFASVRSFTKRDAICQALASNAFPEMSTKERPRRWSVEVEKERPELLSEHGKSQPTSVDVILTSTEDVICVESKFASDSEEGFGKCGLKHGKTRKCKGYYGPGSTISRNNTSPAGSPWCPLEAWDGERSPRLYWALGRSWFQDSVFQPQHDGDNCPFGDSNYQLMRTFLFAASFAARERKRHFGLLVICPRCRSAVLREQFTCFQDKILRPEFKAMTSIVFYEDWVELLLEKGGKEGAELAEFLNSRMSEILRK